LEEFVGGVRGRSLAEEELIGGKLIEKENVREELIGEELPREELVREELTGEQLVGEELAREELVGRREGARRGAKEEFGEELIGAPWRSSGRSSCERGRREEEERGG
jgi:hypothetical protein